MYAKSQTTNQRVFKEAAGAIVGVKTIGKKLNLFTVFEMIIDCNLSFVDIDALKAESAASINYLRFETF